MQPYAHRAFTAFIGLIWLYKRYTSTKHTDAWIDHNLSKLLPHKGLYLYIYDACFFAVDIYLTK